MDDNRGASGGFTKKVNSSSYVKYLLLTLFVLMLLILFSGGFGFLDNPSSNLNEASSIYCGDGTRYNSCSFTKPYFCLNGKLIEYPSICGCPEGFDERNNFCFSTYQLNPRRIFLKYTLRGESDVLSFVVYEGFKNYTSKIPRSITYSIGSNFSRADFKLKTINEEEQRKLLMPLVIKIQNITDNKEDQMRIAISIVQNIPFGTSNRTVNFGGSKVEYTRYPYEVIYDFEGVCGEKTDLLAFLLKEMGYGVSFFYYPPENHEALGLKCPIKESLMGSGYCFVETTAPAIITDNEISYVNIGKLSSMPEIYVLKEGNSISGDLEEYRDARRLKRIRHSFDEIGILGPIQKGILKNIENKYGLAEEYYI